jgi:metal-responsive CopG/Arc/MetJ family transcriptional regulator
VSRGIDASLLKRVDALAKKRGVSRDSLVAEGLETLLAHRRKRA